MASPIITVENLGKCYKLGQKADTTQTFREMLLNAVRFKSRPLAPDFWALKDVSFELNQGEVFGVIGRNGAGKSTLLKILSKIVEPTLGRARLKGRVASLLEVGTGFHPELTGRENVFLNGAILGMKKTEIQRKFDAIVDFAEVDKFLDTPVKRYSSGMYVRLAFAVAAHLEPDVLIVDEVLAVGDAKFQDKCLAKMKDVGETDGRTVLFVSHNMPAVRSLCDRAILLDQGKVISNDKADRVVSQYTTAGALNALNLKVWPVDTAPGTEVAKLRKISVCGENSPAAGVANTDEQVTVTIEYQVLEANSMLNISMQFYDKHDTQVFSSHSMTDDNWYGRPHPPGYYVSKCVIPANLLNDGNYYVSAMLVQDKSHVLALAEKQVTIEMLDTGDNRGGYFGVWPGCMRPILQWKTEREQSTITPELLTSEQR